jgi:ABC-2 type transport system permease protein
MMFRLIASIRKEFILLVRDPAGLAILFLMPMVLILVMTMIQDVSFRKLDETRLPVLFLDQDKDTLGISVGNGLDSSGFFEVVRSIGDSTLTSDQVFREVAKGDYQIGIIIPHGASGRIRADGKELVRKALHKGDTAMPSATPSSYDNTTIILYFDPVMKNSHKQSIRNALENFTSKIEAKITFQVFAEEIAGLLPEGSSPVLKHENTIHIEEIYATDKYNEIVPNSVQHNVPAWAVFAMFFIVIPLTGNLIRERESGTALRLRVMPVSHLNILASKIIVYVVVCFIQFLLMMLVGVVIFPLLGLPALNPGHQRLALVILAFATALAASGYGVLIGTIATTQEQAASFGSVSVIILAAIGGIWVPVFMMPDIMQKLSAISPLNWGLNGFYDIFLRGGGIRQISGNVGLLIGFFVVTMGIAYAYNKGIRR